MRTIFLTLTVGLLAGGGLTALYSDLQVENIRTDFGKQISALERAIEKAVEDRDRSENTTNHNSDLGVTHAELERLQVSLSELVIRTHAIEEAISDRYDDDRLIPLPESGVSTLSEEQESELDRRLEEESDAEQVAYFASLEESFLSETFDDIWAPDTENFVLESLGSEVIQENFSPIGLSSQDASINSIQCRASMCEMTIQATSRQALVRLQTLIPTEISEKISAIRYAMPIRSGNSFEARLFLAVDEDVFNLPDD